MSHAAILQKCPKFIMRISITNRKNVHRVISRYAINDSYHVLFLFLSMKNIVSLASRSHISPKL